MIGRLRRAGLFLITLLLIEFLDELVYGGREAAWPLIRDELGLTYTQIGLLLSLPLILGSLVEPVIGVLGDLRSRRTLVLGGGLAFIAALGLTVVSRSFTALLVAFVLLSPASGAFVSLSQASLMDADPERREHNMARWTFAGSLGVVAGPLALSAALALNIGWRGLFLVFAGLALLVFLQARVYNFPQPSIDQEVEGLARREFAAGLRAALQAFTQRHILRWLALLEFSDLMLDVLHAYLALYLVDVAGLTAPEAALGVAVWTGFGLLGDLALIPLLERIHGLAYLRFSALVELMLYPAFLLIQSPAGKLVILGMLGFFNAGWYSVLKAQLYAAMPGLSGRVMTVGNLAGLVGGLVPVGVGIIAQRYQLEAAMWLLLSGPLALTIGLPKSPIFRS